ncbi:TlpA family protein disulfide reductase [Chitinophaga filiformis]|uniref:TlpA family protein disulfide reductase n=1 Tax=Chitinophaga filiformis TaxID=104663 RepID=A0ABY4HYH7_CHIFI|nr:TlpA disulfide reductase family protein [Chitinophaga filiformis]UPK68069.1 TlpA family protein disulfide reductase [Chitinophaga filiformis]
MKYTILVRFVNVIFLAMAALYPASFAHGQFPDTSGTFTLHGTFEGTRSIDSISIVVLQDISNPDAQHTYKVPVTNNEFRLTTTLNQPARFWIRDFMRFDYFVEPNDDLSVVIKGRNDSCIFSGRGASKLIMLQGMQHEFKNKPKPSAATSSNYLDYYLKLSGWTDTAVGVMNDYLSRFKTTVSPTALEISRIMVKFHLEEARFQTMQMLVVKAPSLSMSTNDLIRIFDTTININEIFQLPVTDYMASMGLLSHARQIIELSSWRSIDFAKQSSMFPEIQYKLAKSKYSGLARDIVTAKLIKVLLRHDGTSESVMYCVNDFLNNASNAYLKETVKKDLGQARRIAIGQSAPSFKLYDARNRLITDKDFKNKVIVMDFWFTGCIPCSRLVPVIREIEHRFKNDTGVVFINVSVDTDKKKWLNSLKEGRFTTGSGISLNATGEHASDIVKDYSVQGFPKLVLIDKKGRILSSMPPDEKPRAGEIDDISGVISNALYD